MDRARRIFQRKQSYEPLSDGSPAPQEQHGRRKSMEKTGFSWVEYGVFLWLGIAMLWAWNMFLAAAPYFQRRFHSNKTLLSNFQATEVSVSTIVNLTCMIVLAKLQARASYPRRITTSLLINIVTFVLLAISTKAFLGVSSEGYFAFLVIMVLVSSVAVGFMQNGTFAFASSYGKQEYMQGIMVGHAIAGVSPPIVQMASVLLAGEEDETKGQESSTSAFAYFLTAAVISATTLLAFFYLTTYHRSQRIKTESAVTPTEEGNHSDGEATTDLPAANGVTGPPTPARSIPLRLLARKLTYTAAAVFITFAITMVFPVFTQKITSTHPQTSPLFRDASFIPFAFLIWNSGDLAGRLVPLIPGLSLTRRPKILLALSIFRTIFIPLYMLCNVRQPMQSPSASRLPETTVRSDFFYLAVVQFPFGLSNGYLGSCCMMGTNNWVDEDEREAAGAFMGLMLVGGLAVGSLCSFFVGNGT